jgi:hypothetical protein
MLYQKLITTKSKRITTIALFSAISIILDSLITPAFSSGVWFGWIFIMSPLNGIILGPIDGFITTFLSVMIGHTLVFRESVYEYIFTLGAPIASLVTGLIYHQRIKPVTIYFVLLLSAYFLTPISRDLPLWGMWDVYLTLIILLVWNFSGQLKLFRNHRNLLALASMIGLEADILFRIFILIPLQGYSIFFGLTPEVLIAIWAVPAPLITPFKVLLSMFFTVLIVPRLSSQIENLEFPL